MNIFFQERMRVAPGAQKAFFASVRDEYIPAARDAGMHPLGFWRVSSVKGDAAEVVALWKLDTWSELARFGDALTGSDASRSPLGSWNRKAGQWVQERNGKIYRQCASTEALQPKDGVPRPIRYCFHETVRVEPNKESEYILGIEVQLAPYMKDIGLNLVGLFRPVLDTGEVINLWSAEQGPDALLHVATQEPDEFYGGMYWMEIAVAIRRQWWRSVWMTPAPVGLF